MVAGVVEKDVDQSHTRIHRLDRRQQHDRGQSVYRQHIFDHGLAGFEVDCAKGGATRVSKGSEVRFAWPGLDFKTSLVV